MSKGFNLILIERDADSLQKLVDKLRIMLSTQTIIKTAVLNKFDQDNINKAVADYITLPIKIFVNCKSSKRTEAKKVYDQREIQERKKAILRDTTYHSTDAQLKSIIEAEDQITNFESSTRAEVHFNGKENIDGFVSLVNMFLRAMLMTSKNPCLINVNNVDGTFQNLKMENGQIFYHATIQFKQNFTEMLGKKVTNLKTINVETSYSKITAHDIDPNVANKLGDRTFAYMGLQNIVKI